MNSNTTTGFQNIIDFTKLANSYISYYKYSYQLRVFDQVLLFIMFISFLYYDRRVRRLEKIIEDCEKCVDVEDDSDDDSDDEDDDSDEDEDEDSDDELRDSFSELQNNLDYTLNRLNRKLSNIQSTISRLETDVSHDNGIFDQKFKTVENKIHKLNERYASLEVMVDELNESETDSESDSDSEYEPEVEERTYNSVSIQNYNDKSFAVYGDTRKFKDELKNLGGKWAPKLSGGPGWIFSNNHRESVDKWFMEYFQVQTEA